MYQAADFPGYTVVVVIEILSYAMKPYIIIMMKKVIHAKGIIILLVAHMITKLILHPQLMEDILWIFGFLLKVVANYLLDLIFYGNII